MSTTATASLLSETFYTADNVTPTSVSSSACTASPVDGGVTDHDKSCSSASSACEYYQQSPGPYHQQQQQQQQQQHTSTLSTAQTTSSALLPPEVAASLVVMSPTPPGTSGSSTSSSPTGAFLHQQHHYHSYSQEHQQQQQHTVFFQQQQQQPQPQQQQPLMETSHYTMSEFIKPEPTAADIEFSGLYGSFEDFSLETLHPLNWVHKSPEQWTPSETIDWVRSWAHHNGVDEMELQHFLYTPFAGPDLCALGRDYFVAVCPSFGYQLFETLQSLLAQFGRSMADLSYHYMTPGQTFLEEVPLHHHHHHHHHQHVGQSMLMQSADVLVASPTSSVAHGHISSTTTPPPSNTTATTTGSIVLPTSSTSDFFAHISSSSGGNSGAIFPPGPSEMHQHHQFDGHAMLHHDIVYSDSDRESPSSLNEKRALLQQQQQQQQPGMSMLTTYYNQTINMVGGGVGGGAHYQLEPSVGSLKEHIAAGSINSTCSSSSSPSLPTSVKLVEQLAVTTSTNTAGVPTTTTTTGKRVADARRRGRPPKKDTKSRNKGNGKLWEFIRDLLLNPITNPSLIRWERREDGIFKFIQSDKVAKMWGERKQNPRMTYEKLSRAMRYYYKSQVLLPVFGRRLVYKFGPNATGWRPQFDMPRPIDM